MNGFHVQYETLTHPFFEGLKPEHITLLASCAMPAHFASEEVIFREGEIANRFYLIERGGVALECRTNRERVCIETVGAGGVIGWSWLFEPFTWHFDAVAYTRTEAVFFYGTRLREMCNRDHELGYELTQRLTKIIIDRLQCTRRELLATKAAAIATGQLAIHQQTTHP
jgi:CRP-like cAMP-binding protein